MTRTDYSRALESLLRMQRRCDILAERLGVDYDADPEIDPGMAVHCVSASLEMAMQTLGNAIAALPTR